MQLTPELVSGSANVQVGTLTTKELNDYVKLCVEGKFIFTAMQTFNGKTNSPWIICTEQRCFSTGLMVFLKAVVFGKL